MDFNAVSLVMAVVVVVYCVCTFGGRFVIDYKEHRATERDAGRVTTLARGALSLVGEIGCNQPTDNWATIKRRLKVRAVNRQFRPKSAVAPKTHELLNSVAV